MRGSSQRFNLPASMDETLRHVRGRLNSVGLVTAFVLGGAALLAAMLLAMLVDYLATLYDTPWRTVLSYSAMAAAGAVLLGWAAVVVTRWRRLSVVAREVDRRTPQLEERWSIVAEHAENHRGAEAPHPAVLRRVADEATRQGAGVRPSEVVPLDGLVRAFLLLNAATVVLVLAAVLDWRQTNVLMRRFWFPGANISATGIALSPGDAVVGRGESLTLVAHLTGAPVDSARLAMQPAADDATEARHVKLIPRAAEEGRPGLVATHRLRSVEQSFAYRVRAGDGQSAWREVTVADRPVIEAATLRVTPPAYRREKPKTLDRLPRRVAIVEGTEVELAVKPRGEVASLRLQTGEDTHQELTPDADGWYRWRGVPEASLALSPVLTEPHGLTNRRPPVTQVRVYPDRPPVVRVLSPDNEVAVTPDDTVEIDFVARDDNGVGAAELVVYQQLAGPLAEEAGLDQVEVERIPIDLGDDAGKKNIRGRVALDLSRYRLSDGASLSYEIRVSERRQTPVAAGGGSAVAARPPRPAPRGSDPAEAPQPPTSQPPATKPPVDATAADRTATDRTAKDRTATTPPSGPASEVAAGKGDPSTGTPSTGALSTGALSTDAPPAGARPANQDDASEAGPAPPGKDSTAVAQTDAKPNPSEERQAATRGNAAAPKADGPNAASRLARQSPTTNAPPANRPAAPSPATDATAGVDAAQESPEKSDGAPSPAADADSRRVADGSAPGDARPNASATAPADSGAPRAAAGGSRMANRAGQGGGGQRRTPGNASANNGAPQRAAAESPDAGDEPRDQEATSDKRSLVADARKTDSEPEDATAEDAAAEDAGETGQLAAAADQQEGENRRDGATAAGAPRVANRAGANRSGMNRSGAGGGNRSVNRQQPGANRASQTAASRNGNPSGNRPPGDNMTRRQADFGRAQSAASNTMRVKVDKWAGSFAGQQRQKLELAIGPEIERFRAHLVRAEKLTRSVLDSLDGGGKWRARDHRDVTSAEGAVRKAQKVVASLRGRTRGTPYAFIGLQLGDISVANLSPARESLWQAYQAEPGQRIEPIRSGWQQVSRALERLGRLVDQYEAAKQEHQLADKAEQIKKMYRVFVEDSMARLTPDEPGDGGKHRRKRAEFELDDEYLARLEEVLKMRQELLAELARILDDDPRLLRRFTNNFQEQNATIRRQLGELRARQEDLAMQSDTWAGVEPDQRPELLKLLLKPRLAETQEIATASADLAERFDAWLPVDEVDENSPAGEAKAQSAAIAARGQQLARVAAAGKLDAAVAEAETLYGLLRDFEVTLRRLGGDDTIEGVEVFALRRIVATRALLTDTSSWIRRAQQFQTGAFERAIAIEQYQLASETDRLAGKLSEVEQQLAGLLQTPDGRLPAGIARLARELLATLDERATPNQLAAAIALQQPDWPRVAKRQDGAVAALAEAEKLFDDLIGAMVTELDKLPVQDPIASLLDDPTLDEILAALEAERDLAERLGIPLRPSNLQIVSDWLQPGRDGGLMTGSSGGMFAAQLRSELRRFRRASDRMRDNALKRAEKRLAKIDRQAKAGKRRPDPKAPDWNKLVSELEDGLLQGRDKLPPEQYRSAIKQYYEIVNRQTNRAEAGDP